MKLETTSARNIGLGITLSYRNRLKKTHHYSCRTYYYKSRSFFLHNPRRNIWSIFYFRLRLGLLGGLSLVGCSSSGDSLRRENTGTFQQGEESRVSGFRYWDQHDWCPVENLTEENIGKVGTILFFSRCGCILCIGRQPCGCRYNEGCPCIGNTSSSLHAVHWYAGESGVWYKLPLV